MNLPTVLNKQIRLLQKQYRVISVGCLICMAYIVSLLYISWVVTFGIWMVVVGSLLMLPRIARYHMGIAAMMIGVLSITPVQTGMDPIVATAMFIGMLCAVLIPFIAERWIKKENLMHLRLPLRRFNHTEWHYFVIAMAIVPLWLVIYFLTSPIEQYWTMTTEVEVWVTFFAIMFIGAWEEFFFIGAVFGLLRRHMSWLAAIVIQACMFTAFLWHIGFKSWGAPFLMAYALYQGYIYYRTKNLTLTLLIHAIVDLTVFVLLFIKIYVL